MTDNTHSLKPCPFCGSDKVQSGGDDKVVGVWCHECAACGPNGYQTSSADWNTRPAEDDLHTTIASQAAVIEQMREALKPFAPKELEGFEDVFFGDLPDDEPASFTVKLGDIRRARNALAANQTGEA